MNKVYLLLGSNMGNRLMNLEKARQLISRQAGLIVTVSGIYETEPWGNKNQGMFYNQVIDLHTALEPQLLLSCALAIEKELGRVRNQKFGPRLMDIDLLFYNNMIISEPGLTLPHPFIQARRFTLMPLHEIASELIHPVLKKSVKQLLDECPDNLIVNRIV
jgi:2-amino-4-hydroxy-6-hydroxymethyldihydropteridine diphosphokinase